MHDEPIADARPDQRTGKPAIICPRVNAKAGLNLHRRHASVEVDLNDAGVGVDVDGLRQAHARIPAWRLQACLSGRAVHSEDEEKERRQKNGAPKAAG